jgi:predicted SprT family Zn-dependent metalloprotease
MSYENNPPRLVAFIDRALAFIKENKPEWYGIASSIDWKTNPNLRRSLGMACYTFNTIEMSGDYVASGADSDVYNTVTHELAHFISLRAYHQSGHGWQWKMVHRALGGSAQRCTNACANGYKIRRNVVTRIALTRNDKTYYVTPARWNKQRYGIEKAGYTYARTVRINSDGSETLLHSHKELKAAEIYLDANLNRIA